MLLLVGNRVGVAVIFPDIGIWHSAIKRLIAATLVFMAMTFFMHLDTGDGLIRLVAGTGFF